MGYSNAEGDADESRWAQFASVQSILGDCCEPALLVSDDDVGCNDEAIEGDNDLTRN